VLGDVGQKCLDLGNCQPVQLTQARPHEYAAVLCK
jgi:hypothetical protein